MCRQQPSTQGVRIMAEKDSKKPSSWLHNITLVSALQTSLFVALVLLMGDAIYKDAKISKLHQKSIAHTDEQIRMNYACLPLRADARAAEEEARINGFASYEAAYAEYMRHAKAVKDIDKQIDDLRAAIWLNKMFGLHQKGK